MKIVKVLKGGIRYAPADKSMSIPVRLDDGSEAWVWVGGEVEVWFDDKNNKAKAFVKRRPTIDITSQQE